jgi:Flp pilus assembly pilin Flp
MLLYTLVDFIADEQAVSSIEYALIGSLIAVVIAISVGVVGTNTAAMWTMVSNCVTLATTGAGSCP